MLLGALVTYRRPEHLANFLEKVAKQTRRADRIVIVDNDPDQSGRQPVERHLSAGRPLAAERIDYLPQNENSGAAGGWAIGQTFLLDQCRDDDWIVMMDDDDPPLGDRIFEGREGFADRMVREDPRTAAVGATGALFDQSRGRLRRLADHELKGPVSVDYLGSNHFPFYRAGVMRELGPFYPGLFLGYTELEYSLRARNASYNFYVNGDSILKRRSAGNRLGLPAKSTSSIPTEMPPWRVYYTTRNMIWMLRANGHPMGALRVSFRRGLGRGLSQLLVSPSRAGKHFRAGLYGIHHGWSDMMGPIIDPSDERLAIREDRITIRRDLAYEPLPPASANA